MKAIVIMAVALVATGCSTSKYANDPRAFLVGPDYLDSIDQFPRDHDTQFYYPLFSVNGMTNWVDPYHSLSKPSPESKIHPLEIEVPEPTKEVQAITGNGWAHLEHTGIPMWATPSY
jgi:hypothetical protein